jgi:oligoendopeptidase F
MPSDGENYVQTAKKTAICLHSEDKRVRKQALLDLEKFLSDPQNDFSNQDLRNIFAETHMYTLNGFRDKTEAVRQQAIKCVRSWSSESGVWN